VYLIYLAFHNDTDILLQDYFNPIRNFITKGITIPKSSFVQVSATPILREENNMALNGHIILIEHLKEGCVEGSITLFNLFHYKINLVRNYTGTSIKLGYGSFFDPFGKKIHSLAKKNTFS
jgi:hypothetical protein